MEIGGQAVIEGVMMKSKDKVAVAVRKDKKIKTKVENAPSFSKKFSKFIFIRGIVSLIEMLYLGIKSLMYSVEASADKGEKVSKTEMFFTTAIATIIAILLFVVLPLYISKFISKEKIIFNLADGIIRILIFISYLGIVSFSKEMKRVFQYHGAEHKAVNCYEKKEKLTVKNAKKYSILHPRCGTSFILIVLIISIIVFSLIWSNYWHIRLLLRILLIPVIAGISYEILKWHKRFKLLTIPGMALQRLTTREPDEQQIEVALIALKKVLK